MATWMALRAEPEPARDTQVDVRAHRTLVLRKRSSSQEESSELRVVERCAPVPVGPCPSPDAQLARATAAHLRVREAIVRLHTPPRPGADEKLQGDPALVRVRIDLLRVADLGVRVRRLEPDTFRVEGRPRGTPIAGRPARAVLAIDGLMYTCAVPEGPLSALLSALASRVHAPYALEIAYESELAAILRARER